MDNNKIDPASTNILERFTWILGSVGEYRENIPIPKWENMQP